MKQFIQTVAVIVFLATPALAYDHNPHKAHNASRAIHESRATAAYKSAMNKMHSKMAIKYTNNADVDFVRGMIPHHQGAIDMAKIVLRYGNDPGVRRLAHNVIREQENEIAWMREWLKRHRY